MGIQGLLPLLKSIERPVHLRDYAGKTLAVDGYVWLHKGAFSCAQELCLGQPTQKYVSYFMRKIEMFKFFGVKPYVVFDGGYLPSKASTEQERLSRREESKKQALELHRAGKSKQAVDQFRKCVDVTPEMAFEVIQALKAAGVDFVVAPYEADAQLCYLEKHGIVDGIVTEDSDLLVFGCKKVIFKLDQYGAGTEILFEKFSRVKEVSFQDWTLTEIRHMCILSGCDYLPSIPGMGLKTAQRLLRKYKTFDKVLRHLRMENTSMKIQSDYESEFRKADLTFLYARVYDPITESMVHLNPIPEDLQELMHTEEYDFLGPPLEPTMMQGIAAGKINPIDKTALSAPAHRRLAHYTKHTYAGKENRPVLGSTLPAGRSINSYFLKTPTAASTPTPTNTDTQKRELPRSDNSTIVKRRVLQASSESDSFANMSSIFPLTTCPYQDKSQSDSAPLSRNVIVESRSRFFGICDTIDTSDACETSTTTTFVQSSRSATLREDSGIGMDEASLLYLVDPPKVQAPPGRRASVTTSPKKSRPIAKETVIATTTVVTTVAMTVESKTADEETTEYKRAEAKVIQGWREKFSNTAQPGRTPGLRRAFQDCGRIQPHVRAKLSSTPVASSKIRATSNTTSATTSTRTIDTGARAKDAQPETTKPIPGLSIYVLDAGRRASPIATTTANTKTPTTTATTRLPDTSRRMSGSSSPSSLSSSTSSSTTATSLSPPCSSSSSRSQSSVEDADEVEDEDEVEDVRPKLCLDRFRYTPSSTSVHVQH
ncbi:Rad2 nuclease [Mortierella sp. AD031]|nr:Rad2 nuclease [Mortierella sp. AD031]